MVSHGCSDIVSSNDGSVMTLDAVGCGRRGGGGGRKGGSGCEGGESGGGCRDKSNGGGDGNDDEEDGSGGDDGTGGNGNRCEEVLVDTSRINEIRRVDFGVTDKVDDVSDSAGLYSGARSVNDELNSFDAIRIGDGGG